MYHKWQSYVWFLRYEAPQTEFFVNLGHILPFYPTNNPKNQNFEKMKKNPGDIIILHKCSKNRDHKLYSSWYMKCSRQNFLSFWVLFCPFTPLTTQINQNFEKMKKSLEIWSFYTSVPKIMIICYTVPEIRSMTDVIVIFHFGLFFAFVPPNIPKNQNLHKMKKNTERYHHFTYVNQKLWSSEIIIRDYYLSSWDTVCNGRTDGWTSGQTGKVIYRGGCPT